MPILPTPPPGGRASIKQAKASFKSRNCDPLSDRDKKQLERAVQLDRRAWGIKQSEKRRDVLKQREDREKQARQEVEKSMLGSQRRCDRFGYKSSQMHLRAFFKAPTIPVNGCPEEQSLQEDIDRPIDEEENTFGEDEIDDESMLHALDVPLEQACEALPLDLAKSIDSKETPKCSMNDVTISQSASNELPQDIWDELASSTQIARDLEEPLRISNDQKTKKQLTQTSSFASSDFDITVEDIEGVLMQSAKIEENGEDDQKLMPPPERPIQQRAQEQKQQLPPAPVKVLLTSSVQNSVPKSKDGENWLTLSQLESFIDEDLQLTQAAPD